MAEPFDSNGPGDETRRYGDYIDGDAGEQLYAGEAVTVSGAGPTFSRTAANGTDQVAGITYIPAENGGNVTVKTHGTMIAAVEPDTTVGALVGTHDGTAENVEAGELSVNGDEFLVLDVGAKTDPRDDTSEDYAEVLKL